ncbi:MAG: primase [Chthoniobacter sp.]|jgi:hypothetical protein|nr:primase [Chthoniobacter sp.]
MSGPINLSELKQRISLKGLFERDNVELKKAGRDTWKCCCPFHGESTPSCVVHEDKAFFKCFGCNARGTIFEYWALQRGIDGKSKEGFAEVCRQLSELVMGHAVPAPKARPATEIQEPERPAPLAGRDLEKWREGCRWLAENEQEQQELAEWRGYRVSLVKQLAEQGKLGMPKYFLSERPHGRLPALSVECVDEKTGEPYLAGFHVRIDPEPGERHAMWHFVPKGIGSWPFVVGDPRKAACIVILEGQWDAIAFIDALDFGAPIKNTAVLGVRGSGAWEKTFAWSWNNDEVQVWMHADSDEAGMRWLHEEQGFAWHLRRRCKALHAGTLDGQKDFNDLHRAACRRDRAEWTKGLRAMMRRQYERGKRTRKYRPKRERK